METRSSCRDAGKEIQAGNAAGWSSLVSIDIAKVSNGEFGRNVEFTI
jgi:hypothetical protein